MGTTEKTMPKHKTIKVCQELAKFKKDSASFDAILSDVLSPYRFSDKFGDLCAILEDAYLRSLRDTELGIRRAAGCVGCSPEDRAICDDEIVAIKKKGKLNVHN